jgi:choline dehydrogenase-like flavoprotein
VCPVNAKFTIENSMMDVYEDARVELLHNAQVYALQLENDKVRKVMFKHEGADAEVEGEVVALGANAIFNAHILLASGDTNKFTGKGITEQRGFYVNMHLKDFENVGGGSAMSANGYMLYDGDFRSQAASCLIESHNGPFVRHEFGKWRHLARFKFIFEDVWNEQNSVSLSDDPLKPAILFSGYTPYVEKGKEMAMSKLQKLFSSLPVEEIFADTNYQGTEAHILASARMGTTANDSVVDDKQIHHQYRNLFVLGGSSFPSITAANPTLTISALSLRSADLSF